MNSLGRIVQYDVAKSDSVLELGCGVMGATSGLKCKRLVGVDAFKEYITFLRARKVEAVLHDLTCLPYPFGDKSYDVVLLLDVLEHLPTLEAAAGLVLEAKRICRKCVIAFTPSRFEDNLKNFGAAPYDVFSRNDLQMHRLLIEKAWLEGYGFNVKRLGFGGGSWYGVYSVKSGLNIRRGVDFFVKDMLQQMRLVQVNQRKEVS